jgi:hypothetical protein
VEWSIHIPGRDPVFFEAPVSDLDLHAAIIVVAPAVHFHVVECVDDEDACMEKHTANADKRKAKL